MTSRPTPRLGARTRRAALAAVVVCGALTLPSQAAPKPLPGAPAAAQYPGQDEIPRPSAVAINGGTVTNSQGAVVSRSKMYITAGPDNPIWGALYVGIFNTPIENPDHYETPCTGFGRPPCVPNPFRQPACATDDPATQTGAAYQPSQMYPLGPLPGGGADVGLVARIPVNLVAFGSIPATATVTMRSPRVNGEVQPFKVHQWQSTGTGRSSSCDPSFSPPVSVVVEGQVEIFMSDLVIDGVPVDLGPGCRTERPSKLSLWGETENGGYFPGSGGNLGAYDGLHPGSNLPLDHPLYLGAFDGRDIPASTGVEVPPFTGCTAGDDDLSPLLTAMASGPNNPVRATQSPTVPFGDLPWDDFTKCSSGICPLPAPATPEMPPLPNGELP